MKAARFEAQIESWMTNNLGDELLFHSQAGIDLNAVWSRQQVPKDMRSFTDAQHYLEIKMDITDPLLAVDSTAPAQDVYEDLLLDSAVLPEVPSGQCSRRYHAFIDVLLHPIYEIPCPFIRMYDCLGQLLPAVITQELVARVFYRPTISDTDTSEDTKEKNHVQFAFEEHPYLTMPCLCLHVCGVRECMTMLEPSAQNAQHLAPPAKLALSATLDIIGMGDNSSINNNNDNNTDDGASSDIYLLRWFSLVGPAIGLNISPLLFAKLFSSPRR